MTNCEMIFTATISRVGMTKIATLQINIFAVKQQPVGIVAAALTAT